MKFAIDTKDLNQYTQNKWYETAANIYNDIGFILIKNLFSTEFTGRLRMEYHYLYSRYFTSKACKEVSNVGKKRPFLDLEFKGVFKDPHYYANEVLLKFLKLILAEDIIIGGQGSFVAQAGAKEQHVHSDSSNMYIVGGEEMVKKGKPYAVTVVFPLVNTNQLCGGTRFWPGSHLQMDCQDNKYVDIFSSPGDALVFDFRTYHAGMANISPIARPMLYTVYARHWYRDQVNYTKHEPLTMSEDMLADIPPEHSRLFNWYFQSKEER